jgi:hypothetical protein
MYTKRLRKKNKKNIVQSTNIEHLVRTTLKRRADKQNYIESVIPATNRKNEFEIFAYCSKSYEDAYHFVINSWTNLSNVSKVTIYTDWDLKSDNEKVITKQLFEPSNDWLIGTGRRLDVIKDYSEENKGSAKNILFLDIDCYIVRDVEEVFNRDFDIAITRLHTTESYANKTATAGLWFARFTPGYYKFINDWFELAKRYKEQGIGIKQYHISYVQYSFTTIARQGMGYKILSLDEKIYNSEHTIESMWYEQIQKYQPKILHFKGRRFRDISIVERALSLSFKKDQPHA